MRITFDRAKREKTLRERGIDFKDARHVFAGRTLDRQMIAKITARPAC
jgi:uncharacterized DUF497 family protein